MTPRVYMPVLFRHSLALCLLCAVFSASRWFDWPASFVMAAVAMLALQLLISALLLLLSCTGHVEVSRHGQPMLHWAALAWLWLWVASVIHFWAAGPSALDNTLAALGYGLMMPIVFDGACESYRSHMAEVALLIRKRAHRAEA